MPISNEISQALRALTRDPDAEFREGQYEAIAALVNDRSRVLVVQRTGWGKSAVYFIATYLLRKQGAGPSLIVSPLLALMNNQIDAARNLGLRAYTINSENNLSVKELVALLNADEVDVLFISPERLANPEFTEKVIPIVGQRPSLIVIDEVHCISEWGHDFRPDYRRLGQVISLLPSGIPILGTTATANDSVIADIVTQLGERLSVIRGPLKRDGLALSVLDAPDRETRLIWLDKNLSNLPGVGIIYCLTQRDVDLVAKYLGEHGHKVARYRSGSEIDQEEKDESLRRFLSNEVKAVIATTALGMGYDKPDVGFVIHYQSPGSLVGYYQQVGRAGRSIDASIGIMMRGLEDKEINEFFNKGLFPKEEDVNQILTILENANGPVQATQIEKQVNLKRSVVDNTMKQLHVEGIVDRIGNRNFLRTLKKWKYPQDRIDREQALRRLETEELNEYFSTDQCRMRFIINRLNDPDSSLCGICDNCTGSQLTADFISLELQESKTYLQYQYLKIPPRKINWDRRRILLEEQLMEGMCLSKWRDGEFGDLVAQGKKDDHHFSDELVNAMIEMIERWDIPEQPKWITCVPSTRSGELVPDFTKRIAEQLNIPLNQIISKAKPTNQQKYMENSSFQGKNVSGAFQLDSPPAPGAVFLLDDLFDSRWTMTEVGRLLRQNGSGNVYPLALASSQSKDS